MQTSSYSSSSSYNSITTDVTDNDPHGNDSMALGSAMLGKMGWEKSVSLGRLGGPANAPIKVHYTLYTIHYTLYTIHYTIYFIHYTLYTIHYTPTFVDRLEVFSLTAWKDISSHTHGPEFRNEFWRLVPSEPIDKEDPDHSGDDN